MDVAFRIHIKVYRVLFVNKIVRPKTSDVIRFFWKIVETRYMYSKASMTQYNYASTQVFRIPTSSGILQLDHNNSNGAISHLWARFEFLKEGRHFFKLSSNVPVNEYGQWIYIFCEIEFKQCNLNVQRTHKGNIHTINPTSIMYNVTFWEDWKNMSLSKDQINFSCGLELQMQMLTSENMKSVANIFKSLYHISHS